MAEVFIDPLTGIGAATSSPPISGNFYPSIDQALRFDARGISPQWGGAGFLQYYEAGGYEVSPVDILDSLAIPLSGGGGAVNYYLEGLIGPMGPPGPPGPGGFGGGGIGFPGRVLDDGATPAAPTGLTATALIRAVLLEWDANTETDMNHYEIWRHTSNDSSAASKIAEGYLTLIIDGDRTEDQTYYYWIKAVDHLGNTSGFSTPSFVGSIQGAGAPNYLRQIMGVTVSGNYAYAASTADSSLTIIDVSNPAAPTLAGVIRGSGAPNYLGGANNVVVSGNYAYVCAGSNHALTIIDISNPAAPTFVGSIQGYGSPNYLGGGFGLALSGNYAYVCAGDVNALTIIDISTPSSPTFVGSIQGAGAPNYLANATRVVVSGNYAYVVAMDDNSLTIIDISTPATPTFVGSIQGAGAPNYLGEASGIAISGNYAYVAAGADDSLTVIDISTPAAPVFAGSIQGAGSPNYLGYLVAVTIVSSYAYIAAAGDNALTIIDISTPATPTFVDSIQGAGSPNYLGEPFDIAISGNYAYVASFADDALTIINLVAPNATATGIITSGTIQAEQLTSTDDITMLGHLFSLGDNTDTNILLTFDGLTNDASLTYKPATNDFDFGSSKITSTDLITGGSGRFDGGIGIGNLGLTPSQTAGLIRLDHSSITGNLRGIISNITCTKATLFGAGTTYNLVFTSSWAPTTMSANRSSNYVAGAFGTAGITTAENEIYNAVVTEGFGYKGYLGTSDGAGASGIPRFTNGKCFWAGTPTLSALGQITNGYAFYDEGQYLDGTRTPNAWGFYGLSPKNYMSDKLLFGQTDGTIGIYSQADGYLDFFADGGVRIGDSSAGAPTNCTMFNPTGNITQAGSANAVLNIDGGTIDGAAIGATTPSSGIFTTLVVDSPTLVVNASGYENMVGIGTATPARSLHIKSGAGAEYLRLESFAADQSVQLEFYKNTGARYGLFGYGGGTAFYTKNEQGSIHIWPLAGSVVTMGDGGTTNYTSFSSTGILDSTLGTATLGAGATTFAIASNVMTITGDGGGNTVATITGASRGTILTLTFVDALVTITDNNAHDANSVDLSAAFTSADDTTLTLVFNGTSWYETSRSVN